MKQRFEVPDCAQCSSRADSIFCELNHAGLSSFSGSKLTHKYKRGQVIFYEGTRPSGLFCINHGKVKIYKTSENGREHIVRLAKDGDVLGYRALLSGELYSATAEPLEETTICQIPQSVFFEVLHTNAALMNRVMHLLAQDLKQAESRMVELSQLPVRERLAQALLMLLNTFGTETDGMTLDVQLTREEIANIVGTATESTIRLLSEFKKEGILELRGKKIVLVNKGALTRIANVFD